MIKIIMKMLIKTNQIQPSGTQQKEGRVKSLRLLL